MTTPEVRFNRSRRRTLALAAAFAFAAGVSCWVAWHATPTAAPRHQGRELVPATESAAARATATLAGPPSEAGHSPAPQPAEVGNSDRDRDRASNAAATPPVSALRAAFEHEAPDASAREAEDRIREIFAHQDQADLIFRDARCKRSACRMQLNWSPELSPPYNQGLVEVVHQFSREISIEPDGAPDAARMPLPITVFVARPGHTVHELARTYSQLVR